MAPEELSPELILLGYSEGIFPMAHQDENWEIYWYDPDPRAIIPLESFHTPKNVAKACRRGVFEITEDRDFEAVIRACAAPRKRGDGVWISEEIIRNYVILHKMGYAHSLECCAEGELVGGLYGVSIGAAFFGESMFHRATDASKVALAHLVRKLRAGDYKLLDVQFSTPHLRQFGVKEISRRQYRQLLSEALRQQGTWKP